MDSPNHGRESSLTRLSRTHPLPRSLTRSATPGRGLTRRRRRRQAAAGTTTAPHRLLGPASAEAAAKPDEAGGGGGDCAAAARWTGGERLLGIYRDVPACRPRRQIVENVLHAPRLNNRGACGKSPSQRDREISCFKMHWSFISGVSVFYNSRTSLRSLSQREIVQRFLVNRLGMLHAELSNAFARGFKMAARQARVVDLW